MTSADLTARIRRRAGLAGLDAPDGLTECLGAYYAELCHWNRAINLTSLRLEPNGTDESIDKLLIEPLAAAPYLPEGPGPLLDVGSGGGSPAIPLKIARPEIELWMVEARQKKAVFLRRVSRQLGLERVIVEQAWLKDLSQREELRHRFRAACIRAVRLDEPLAEGLSALLAPGGEILYFSAGETPHLDVETRGLFSTAREVPLIAATNSRLNVLHAAPVR